MQQVMHIGNQQNKKVNNIMMNFDEMFKKNPAKGRIWGQAYNTWGGDKLKQVLETVWDQIPGDDEKTIDTATQLIDSQLQQQAPQQASQQAPMQATQVPTQQAPMQEAQVPTQQAPADKLREMILGMSGDTQAAAPMHWGEALGAGLAGIGASIQNAAGMKVDVGTATQNALLPYLTRVKDAYDNDNDNTIKNYLQKKLIDEEAGLNYNKNKPKIEEGINPETGRTEAYYMGPGNKPIFIGVGQELDAPKKIGEFIRDGNIWARMSDGSEIEVGPDTPSATDASRLGLQRERLNQNAQQFREKFNQDAQQYESEQKGEKFDKLLELGSSQGEAHPMAYGAPAPTPTAPPVTPKDEGGGWQEPTNNDLFGEGPSNSGTPPQGYVYMYGPDKRTYRIPLEKEEEFISKGYVKKVIPGSTR